MPLKSWEREHALRMVASINAVRETLGLTIPRLRDRLEKFGWNLSTETLNGILSAKKRGSFSIGELFAFSRALDVSPLYLVLGMPDSRDLPDGPLLVGEPDLVSAYQWIADAEVHILDGSPLGLFAKYAEQLAMAKWHNALWAESDGELGRDEMDEDLKRLIYWRGRWRQYLDSGREVPEMPDLPPALAALRLDDLSDPPRLSAPLEDFSGPRWEATADAYMAGLRAAQEEIDRLHARAGVDRGSAAD